jgi:uncharacterized protein (UPF0332 family)
MLTVDLTEDAGRAAYLAAYQAAEALIFDFTGKVTKTNKGAHREFARLTANEPRLDRELRQFLPQAYDLKAICDYELGPDAVVPRAKAEMALETARRFVECIAGLLDPGASARC